MKQNIPLKKISFLHLVAIVYFTVSGGAFGLEELVSSTGPGLALLLLILTPFLWGLPVALMVAEMGAMLPIQGGYYRWVHFAMGRFWGFPKIDLSLDHSYIDSSLSLYHVKEPTGFKNFPCVLLRQHCFVLMTGCRGVVSTGCLLLLSICYLRGSVRQEIFMVICADVSA